MEPFKNFISAREVDLITLHLSRHLPEFDGQDFQTGIMKSLLSLELKQRAALIASALHNVLPPDAASRNAILAAMLHPDPLDQATQPSDDKGISGWGLWPLTMVVGTYGLEDFDASLALLKEMTKRGTSEFDVRPFLQADQERALAIITPWASDENIHVRRLASEGTRPRLPWGMQLKQLVTDPSPTLPILHAMRDDPEEYVRRSVANHLNDIAKDHPDLVAGLANDWMSAAPAPRQKLVRHACRTLIKQGHPMALAAFGVGKPDISEPVIRVLTPQVDLGSALSFAVDLSSGAKKPQKLIIDYVIHFQKVSGTLAAKVFKWKQMTLEAGQTVSMTRDHAIRPITTRKYYAGTHALSLRINGRDFGREEFELAI